MLPGAVIILVAAVRHSNQERSFVSMLLVDGNMDGAVAGLKEGKLVRLILGHRDHLLLSVFCSVVMAGSEQAGSTKSDPFLEQGLRTIATYNASWRMKDDMEEEEEKSGYLARDNRYRDYKC